MKKIRNVILCTIVLAIILLLTTTTNASNNLTVSDINVVVTNTKAELEWSKANDANGYQVYVDIPSIGYQYVGNVASNKVTIIGFEEGEIYGVKVRAYNENGASSTYSPEIRFKIGEDTQTSSELGTVKNIKAVSNGATGTIEWDKVTNADGYEIYASVQNSDYIDIGSTTSTKVRLIGMDENEVYSIKIKPYLTKSNEKVYGSFSDLAILKYEDEEEEYQELDRVTNLKSSINGDKATLTWNNVSNADGYEVLVQISGHDDATYTVSSNKITLTGFTAGYTYRTKVRAYEYVNGEKEYGAYSSTVSIKIEEEEETVDVDKVTGLKAKVDGTRAVISWNEVSDADGYQIELTKPGYSNTITYSTTGTSKTLTGVTDTDDDYAVRVRAYKNVNGERVYGDYSSKVYFRAEEDETDDVTVNKVTGLKVSMNGSKATVTWNKVSNADGYELSLNIPGTGPDSTYTTTGTSKTINGFTDKDSNYSIRVRAYKTVNGEKVYGDYSTRVYFKNNETSDEENESDVTVSKVTGLDVDMDGNIARFTWNRVSNADGYELVVTDPQKGDTTYKMTTTYANVTGIRYTSSNFTAKVRAYKTVNGKKVYGSYSSKVSFRNTDKDDTDGKDELSKVTGLRATRNGTSATFRWNSVSGASGYEIVLEIPGYGEAKYTVTGTNKTMSGFTTTRYPYTIKVRAFGYINGRKVYSDYSSEVEF